MHDNARSLTSRHITEEIAKIRWKVLPHPLYSPVVAASDFHLFGPLKEKTSLRQWLSKKDHAFYHAEVDAFVKRKVDLNCGNGRNIYWKRLYIYNWYTFYTHQQRSRLIVPRLIKIIKTLRFLFKMLMNKFFVVLF